MRLTDVVNHVGSRVREVITFIRHPDQILLQTGRRKAQDVYEKAEFPKLGQRSQDLASPESEASVTQPVTAPSSQEFIQSNRVSPGQPIVSEQPLLRSHPGISSPFYSSFMNLTETKPLEIGKEIRGGRGKRYEIVALLEDKGGQKKRIYQAVQALSERIVLLKEYLLLKENLSGREVEESLDRFEDLSNLNISEEQGKRFRIIVPQDIIVDRQEKRCYLVSEPLENCLTLREWLNATETITFHQTIKILDDILQTLWFIHNHKFRFGGNLKPSLAHKNLTPDSIKIVIHRTQEPISKTPFSVYLADLALWENLILSSATPQNQFNPIFDDPTLQDLIDLGYLCLYLLSRGRIDGDFGRAVDLQTIEDKIALISPSPLEFFIRKLLGLEEPFSSAEEARKYLRTIEDTPIVSLPEEAEEKKENREADRKIFRFIFKLLLFLGAIGLIALFLKFFWEKIFEKPEQQVAVQKDDRYECCFSKISLSQGKQKVKYATVRGSHWHNLFVETTGVFPIEPPNYKKYPDGKTLKDEIEQRYPTLSKQYIYQCSKERTKKSKDYCDRTTAKIIQDLISNKLDFALLRSSEKLPNQLTRQVIAYDVVVPVVAFSAYTRDKGIAQSLQGKISSEQLRSLYTEKSNTLPGQKIKDIYFSPGVYDLEIRQLFEEFLQKKSTPNLAYQDVTSFRNKYSKIVKKSRNLTTNMLLERILSDFENEGKTSIALTFLSSVFAQCSVYPLAILEGERIFQSVVQNNNKPITPQIDLCNDKGSYFPTYTPALESGEFPLVYSLAVVYPKKGSGAEAGKKFAEMLKTDEGQYLIREMGLIPVRELRRY
ncbi:hypothetical protein [Oscillatoria sp. FACHB-1406]|uniref:hypothetical protein n=1 Tax=Oscillatoria sp. FACHB-1406 TaxID=2692846 RepID=UPI00168608D2|nr:hypothetical protein [Oscillatoria sp. FACHB-1406]MBD2576496.1 hypothetical protein [Oscillatoria sp. FACHB-1406]